MPLGAFCGAYTTRLTSREARFQVKRDEAQAAPTYVAPRAAVAFLRVLRWPSRLVRVGHLRAFHACWTCGIATGSKVTSHMVVEGHAVYEFSLRRLWKDFFGPSCAAAGLRAADLRRSRCRYGAPQSAALPRRRHPDRRVELPAASACRSHAGARPLQGLHQLANPATAAVPPRSATQKRAPDHPSRLITASRQLRNFTSAQVGTVRPALTAE